MFCNRAVKSLSIFPVCINLLQLFYITSSSESHPYKWCIVISGVSFLKVLFSCIIHSEFLILTHCIPKMMVSENNYEGGPKKTRFFHEWLIYLKNYKKFISCLQSTLRWMICTYPISVSTVWNISGTPQLVCCSVLLLKLR